MLTRKRLSSRITWFYKLGLFALFVWIAYWCVVEPQIISNGSLVIFLVVLLIPAVIIFRWKDVYLVGDTLEVSNGVQKCVIPTSRVRWIEGSSFLSYSPSTVTITFDEETKFGKHIVFVPNGAWFWPPASKSFADNLRVEFGIPPLMKL